MDDTISSLKGLYGDSIEMPLPVNTTSSYLQTSSRSRKKKFKFCDHCHRKGHNKFECWADIRATGQSKKENRLEAEHKSKNGGNKKDHDASSPDGIQKGCTDDDDETFFISFAGVKESNLSTECPFAIVDTSAVASMIGKEYLNKVMSTLCRRYRSRAANRTRFTSLASWVNRSKRSLHVVCHGLLRMSKE
jgi:hypothetical protein